MKLLIVEDDKDMANTLYSILEKDYTLDIATSGEDALFQTEVYEYDLILLDYILPGLSGIELLKALRKNIHLTPILMITGKDDITKRVDSLDNGCDDYLIKPFHTAELKARIRALLRRPLKRFVDNDVNVGDLQIDLSKKSVQRNGQKIQLRRKEFDLLEYFVRNEGKVLTRSMILDHIWDSSYDSFTNVVDVHINYLRERIDKPFPKKLIKTVHGIGYKLEV